MGVFGNKKPKLPSYVGVGLDALLQDPEWAHAISQAGIDVHSCEIVLRLSEPTVGDGSSPENPKPAVLFGQGNILAIAYPSEREVKVVKRDKSRGELQTQRSGWFQIIFGPISSLDGFMFWGAEDNLKVGTPEGEKFGEFMSAFLKGQLKPQQIIGTPQSLASSGHSVESSTPVFEDTEDALRWKLFQSLRSSLDEWMEKYQECFEKFDLIDRAFAIANTEYYDGVRQAEQSKETFRLTGVRYERELEVLLGELRAATTKANSQWEDLVFLLPGSDNDVTKIATWSMSNGVDSEAMSSVVANGMYTRTDFGVTRESFRIENERITAILDASQEA